MEITAQGTAIKSIKGTDAQSCAFPGICVLPSGRWLVSCRAAYEKKPLNGQHVLVSYSDDEGMTWSDHAAPFVPVAVGGNKGLFRSASLTALGGESVMAAVTWVDNSDPELPFFNEETEGLLDTKIFISKSEDGGVVWSRPVPAEVKDFPVPVPLTGPVLKLANGELACQFELNKHYNDLSEWHHSSVFIFSKDNGATWKETCVVGNDPENRFFYWDQRPNVMNDGSILNVFWSYDNKAAAYVNIHARKSTDNGRSWSDFTDIGVPGQPAPPVQLSSGKIVLVYVDRESAPKIMARESIDEGKTFPKETELLIYDSGSSLGTVSKGSMQDAWSEMGNFSVGLPCTALLPDDSILTAYYAGESTDITDICWARIK